jgi:hypothetical protein
MWFDNITTPESLKKPHKRKPVARERALPKEFDVDIVISKNEHVKRSTNEAGSHIKVRINGGRPR